MIKLSNRFDAYAVFLLCIAIIIIVQIVNLQVVKGSEYNKASLKKLLRDKRIVAQRGNIFDRNGIPIASNRMSYSVDIIKVKEKNDELNEKLLRLVNLFEKNGDNYENNLKKYITFNPIKYGPYLKDSKTSLERWKLDMVGNEMDAPEKTKILESLKTAKDLFKYLQAKFAIDKKYSDSDAYKIMIFRYEILIKGYSVLDALPLARDVSRESVSEISERGHLFQGIDTNIEPIRTYNDAESVAHVVGYVANLNSDEYEKLKDKKYQMTDLIGKSGIEKSLENDLRGQDGLKSIEIDSFGKETNQLNIKPAVPGKDVTLSIDLKMQKVAMNSLVSTIKKIRTGTMGDDSNKHDAYFGSAVAIDVKTGEVLVMASYPSYDPAIFLADKNDKEAQKAIAALFDPNNKATSSYNRALSGAYPPGSTFKPVVGLAALEKGLINKNTLINDPGSFVVEGKALTCLEWRRGEGAHGDLNLKDGLKTSCNVFFYKLGMQTGISSINDMAQKLGLGEYTEIEIGGETKGQRSTPEFHDKLYDYKFGKVLTAYSSIGQGYNLFTPLQLASYVSTLANGGNKVKPHLVKSVSNDTGTIIKDIKPEITKLNFKKENLNAVKEGMIAVTAEQGGTAKDAFKDLPYTVAAKTGTAEGYSKDHSDNAVFIAYAPAEDPKIAVAIVLEKGVYGSYSAPIARDIMIEYFKSDKEVNLDESADNQFSFTK